MTTAIITQRKWNIPKKFNPEFDEKALERSLRSFNKMSGGSYAFFDLYHEKLIVDTSEARILCGHPKRLAEKKGFGFFNHIFTKKELNRLKQLWQLAADFFSNLDENERENFILLFDANVKMKNGEKMILHHKVVPYQLCDNGNLRLALACVSSSSSQEMRDACIINKKLEARYDLIDDAFVFSKIHHLMPMEKTILLLLGKSMSEPDICEVLGILKGKYHRIKNEMFKKLGADTSAGAVYMAYRLGLI